ncbi:MAG TPA: protein-glutamate O-methyltransferase CheR [Longimicrobiales bacterium]
MPPDERSQRTAPAGSHSEAQPSGVPPLPLAHGDLSDADAAELRALKQQIQATVGFFCEGYKEKCLRRRIAVRMRARGVHSYAQYAALLASDGAEYEQLVDTLTINVSKFFRNPEVWEMLSRNVLPELAAREDPVIRIWSAGTAGGEEAYSAAIMVQEFAQERGVDPDRFEILGTDIDRESLAFARRAEYTEFAMTDIEPELRDRWFDHDGVYRLKAGARRNVRFETLDLIREPHPRDLHLIFCRNVIIYFERAVQEQLFRQFHDALVPGGYLVLGKVEALFGAQSGLFQTMASRQRIFRRA